jgi:hypothetical protein
MKNSTPIKSGKENLAGASDRNAGESDEGEAKTPAPNMGSYKEIEHNRWNRTPESNFVNTNQKKLCGTHDFT